MAHIFISYSKQDITFARHLKRLLEARGFTTWMDETRLHPSARWWAEIEDNIEGCAALVVIMSPNSRESDWVERELLYAERLRRPIFPILLAGEHWPRLANLQYTDMRAGLQADLPPMFVEALAGAIGQPVSPAPPPPGTYAAPPPTRVQAPPPPRKRRRWPRLLGSLLLVIVGSCIALGVLGSLLGNLSLGGGSGAEEGAGVRLAIVEPPDGAAFPIGEVFPIGVIVDGLEGEAILGLFIGEEFVDERPIDGDADEIIFDMGLPEPGDFELRAELWTEELLAVTRITVSGYIAEQEAPPQEQQQYP